MNRVVLLSNPSTMDFSGGCVTTDLHDDGCVDNTSLATARFWPRGLQGVKGRYKILHILGASAGADKPILRPFRDMDRNLLRYRFSNPLNLRGL